MKNVILSILMILIFKINLYDQWNVHYVNSLGQPNIGCGVKNLSISKNNVVWASTFDTSGVNLSNYFYKTIDNGITWNSGVVNTPGGLKDITSICGINKDTAWAVLNKHGGGSFASILFSKVLKTTDGGINWIIQPSASFTGPTNHINFIHFKDENNGICVGDSNSGYWEMYTTNNGGTNWSRIPNLNIPTNIINEKGIDNCFDTFKNNLWFGTTKGRIYKSVDFGNSWNVNYTGLSNISNITMEDSLIGLATDSFTIVKTTDGGTTWNPIIYNGVFYKNSVSSDINNPNKYYSCGWEQGNFGSSYSLDGGLNWISIDNIPHTVVNFKTQTGWSGGLTLFGAANDNSISFYNWIGTINSLKNISLNNELEIFPNPFSHELNLNFKENEKTYNLEIYNSLGILVDKLLNIKGYSTAVKTSSLNSGVYLFKIYCESEFIGSKTIIKE